MPIPNPKKTKKKFYNQFIYKVTLDAPGSGALRWYNFSQILNLSTNTPLTVHDWQEKILSDLRANTKFWIDLTGLILQFDKKEWRKRLEGNNLDLYTNNKPLYTGLCNTFPNQIIRRFEPAKGTEQTLLNSHKQIFCKEIPHSKYNYRCYLHPHKLDIDQKEKVCEWFDRQGDNTTFSKSIKQWFLTTNENWDRRYVLIDNEQTMLLLRLLSPSVIGQTHKYVKHDK